MSQKSLNFKLSFKLILGLLYFCVISKNSWALNNICTSTIKFAQLGRNAIDLATANSEINKLRLESGSKENFEYNFLKRWSNNANKNIFELFSFADSISGINYFENQFIRLNDIPIKVVNSKKIKFKPAYIQVSNKLPESKEEIYQWIQDLALLVQAFSLSKDPLFTVSNKNFVNYLNKAAWSVGIPGIPQYFISENLIRYKKTTQELINFHRSIYELSFLKARPNKLKVRKPSEDLFRIFLLESSWRLLPPIAFFSRYRAHRKFSYDPLHISNSLNHSPWVLNLRYGTEWGVRTMKQTALLALLPMIAYAVGNFGYNQILTTIQAQSEMDELEEKFENPYSEDSLNKEMSFLNAVKKSIKESHTQKIEKLKNNKNELDSAEKTLIEFKDPLDDSLWEF